MSVATIILATLVVYKLVLIGIGFWASSRNHDTADFFLSGRALGPWIAGMSYAASTSSAWVLLGYSGFVYAIGVSAIWMVPGIWAGYAVVWLVFGARLQAESKAHNQLTLTDFLLQGVPAGGGRRLAAILATLLIVTCFVFYIAAQFDAAGRAFSEHFYLSVPQATLIGASIVVLYCILGGFWAVSVTDALQGFIMALVCIMLPLGALFAAGGPIDLLEGLGHNMPPAYLDPFGGFGPLLFVGFLIGVWGTSLGALGQPHLMSRLMAIRDTSARYRGFLVTLIWGIIVFIGMTVLGLAGRLLLPELASGEALFYAIADDLLPPVLAGVVIAATLSAVMSTVDSILLAASAAVAHDLGVVHRFPSRQLLVSRLTMLSVAALAIILTLSLSDTIFNRVLFAWSALGAAFGPVLAARVAGRTPPSGLIIAAMLSGFLVTVLFYMLGAVQVAEPGFWIRMAQLPGDPFERAVPWILPLLLLFIPWPVRAFRMAVAGKAALQGEASR